MMTAQTPVRPTAEIPPSDEMTRVPVQVLQGEALYHIARFEEVGEVAQSLEEFTHDIEEGPTLSGEPPIV